MAATPRKPADATDGDGAGEDAGEVPRHRDLSSSTSFGPAGPGRDARQGEQTMDFVRRAQAGDRQALDALLQRYHDFVRRVVRIKAGPLVLSRYEVDDLVQDGLLAAFRSFRDFEIRHDSSFRAWIHTVVVRQVLRAVERIRTQGRDPRRERALDDPLGSDSSGGQELEGDITLPPDRLRRKELTSAVDDEIARCDEPERTLLVYKLFVYGDAGGRPPWKDIGPELGLTPDAARVRCSRALVELQSRLRRRGFLGPGESRG